MIPSLTRIEHLILRRAPLRDRRQPNGNVSSVTWSSTFRNRPPAAIPLPDMSMQSDDSNSVLFTLIAESIWRTSSVNDEPQIKLIQWDIKQDNAGNGYFVGTRADDGSGRVSTAIVEFDPERRRGRTQSGRVYELLGAPGYSSNGEYLWSIYKVANGITEPTK